ncbi:HAD family hydrolase [Saccharopolyspora griseoalba]|uniref:HAD family hydrolase n=1 Tax=Saccharopolyspora griseoalba TaxID=1431848 RepID=A0ABW2LIH2_9PSEU
MPTAERIDLVLLDVGGPIYDDVAYRDALLRAAQELAAEEGRDIDEAEFQRVCDDHRQQQAGSLRSKIAERFFTPALRERLSDLAQRYWEYPASCLYDDVLPALRLVSERYRIALVANQRTEVLRALRRDGVAEHVDIWAISEALGVEKPDPRIFRHALREAGVDPANAVHVGNRLDSDVRGAKGVGLRTVWVLRGEAPPNPTPEQLAETDLAVRTLAELPDALEQLSS